MPRKNPISKAESIRNELAWLRIPIEPGRCGCGHFRCVATTGHDRGRCPNPATSKLPTFGLRYLCATCEEYHSGARAAGSMVARRAEVEGKHGGLRDKQAMGDWGFAGVIGLESIPEFWSNKVHEFWSPKYWI